MDKKQATAGAGSFAPINGQQLPPWRDMPYGVSDLGRAGCEAIAAYNAMALLGRPEPLGDVVSSFVGGFSRGLLNGWGMGGRWGAAPWDIRRFLRERGVAFRGARTLRGLKSLIDGPGVVILSYWNRPVTGGYHTVAAAFDGERYTVYNQNCASARPVAAKSPDELMAGGWRFIHGFYIRFDKKGVTSDGQ